MAWRTIILESLMIAIGLLAVARWLHPATISFEIYAAIALAFSLWGVVLFAHD